MAMNAPSASNIMSSSPGIMQPHDPNDDPFAALASDTDDSSKQLVSPMEFGMGLKNVKQAAAVEDATEVTHEASESTLEEENPQPKEEPPQAKEDGEEDKNDDGKPEKQEE